MDMRARQRFLLNGRSLPAVKYPLLPGGEEGGDEERGDEERGQEERGQEESPAWLRGFAARRRRLARP